MKGGFLTMSDQEIKRVTVITQVAEKRLKQREAMRLLDLSKRQIIRLVKDYRKYGPVALISKQRGKPSNHCHKSIVKTQVKELVHKHYHDFGPKFAAEKLKERHQIDVSKETLRQWMMEWELWKAKRQKKAVAHQSRERRACFGELIQIDGSPHDWFEGRAPKCCLLVFIDDATSRLVGLHFVEQETTAGYFTAARTCMEKHGKPLAFYSDKYGVFRVNHKNCEDKETQFGRAMRELNVELICANSPQAKGRVERSNQTLQDRLVKEMRLRGISSIEAANAYAPEFMADHNQRYAVDSRSAVDAHRKDLPDKKTLDLIFSFQDDRTLSKNLEMEYNNVTYKIQTATQGYGLRHAKITVCEDLSGVVTLVYKGRVLTYTTIKKQKRAPAIVDAKELDDKMVGIRKYAPAPPNHPWRQQRITHKNVAQA
jgi:hypothetical protein